jgi:hypothetical protein
MKTPRILFLTMLLALGTANAQSYTVLKSFGILTNMTGLNPRAPLIQGPDGNGA